ncbi:MAG: hypothetical protein IJQ94_03855 [Bacteroidales bacterium]|nr:hypothetical protein [Bacteroidales bacterium]MBR4135710.1 hypothetical protein [Bacteroidales bacterium]
MEITVEDFDKVDVHIGSVKSEVRILGSESASGVVLLQPTMQVKNGDKVF